MITNEQFQVLCELLHKQVQATERLAAAVERIPPTKQQAPNYQKPLEQFNRFDWEEIGATVEKRDQYGAAVVTWNGQQFTRRSPSNKYGEAIFFSRCIGKGDDGSNIYERLITFKPLSKIEAEPIPDKVLRLASPR